MQTTVLDETHDKCDQLQHHLSVYQNLREQLENAAKTAGKTLYENVTKDYEEYADLVLEAAQLLVGLSSRMEVIKDRMDFKLKRRTVKVNIDQQRKMLETKQQKADIEHRKLQIKAERLNLEKEKLRKKLEADTTRPRTKLNTINVCEIT